MIQRWPGWCHRLDGQAVQITFQNGFHALVGAGVESDGAAAGGFQARRGVDVAEPQHAETGTVTLLGMRFAGHDFLKQVGGGRTDLLSPVHQPGRGPFQISLMRLGAVLGNGGSAMALMAADMTGHPQSAVKDLYRGGRSAYFYFLLDQLIRHAVPVVIEGHMVIDVDAMGFPVAVLIALCWQWTQHRLIEQFEKAAAATVTFAKRTLIEPCE